MLDLVFNNFDLHQIAHSGQCFRMTHLYHELYQVIARNRVLHIEHLSNSSFRFYCSEEEFDYFWYDYFDLGSDYAQYIKSIPAKDVFLTKAAALASGVRILQQDPWETLISFIISQRKNIPAIQRSIELLCQQFGEEIDEGIYSFPSPESLSLASIEALNACSLGYRSKYISHTAKAIASGEVDLQSLQSLEDAQLLESLCRLSGVGVKVASCVMLFAYHRIAAFPIDVWIARILQREYDNAFDTKQYAGFAGVIQQYMFYYAQHSEEYKKLHKWNDK